MNVNCGRSVKNQVADRNAKHFRDASTGVVEDGEESPVPLTAPSAGVWGIENALDLFPREKFGQRAGESFHGHSQGMLNAVELGEIVMSRVLQERAQCCQACVAAAHGVFAFGFQIIQEGQDELRVQIGEQEMLGISSKGLLGKSKQQAERVPVSNNGPWAYGSVLLQMLCEEALEKNGEGRSRLIHWAASCGAQRSPRSCGRRLPLNP